MEPAAEPSRTGDRLTNVLLATGDDGHVAIHAKIGERVKCDHGLMPCGEGIEGRAGISHVPGRHRR